MLKNINFHMRPEIQYLGEFFLLSLAASQLGQKLVDKRVLVILTLSMENKVI